MPQDTTLSAGPARPPARPGAPAATLTLTASPCESTEATLERAVEAALGRGCRTVVLDLSRVELGAASLPVLVRLQERVATAGGVLAVAGPSGRSRARLDRLRGGRHLVVYPAVPAPPPWSETGSAVYV
ncbi:STAS domain-containing protein [Phycicoccus sp.]|uniref:STAS domain-containing protein n=1 Tax=Phycicoccus sp. TaxID=1902410 RepID=UPI002D0C8F73|nr:STAS domain-containing protein [Phycicoccus sp.]HMM94946.1 STAS domain-containing protein [Phycicoccus sp.]